jgi:DNA-binding FadR family transcriptional regulator
MRLAKKDTGKSIRVAQKVAAQIRNAIVRGELTQEDNLPAEAQLIRLFDVSRPTLREAIRILEGEDLIEVSRGARGGAKVKPFTPDVAARAIGQTLQADHTTLDEVFEARRIIEPPAAALAARNKPKAAALELRKQIILEYESLGQFPRMAHVVSGFHIRLVEVSGNRALALVGRALQEITLTHLELIQYGPAGKYTPEKLLERQRESLQSHEALAEMIEHGDAAGAEKHWRDYLDRSIPIWLVPPLKGATLDVLERPVPPIDWRAVIRANQGGAEDDASPAVTDSVR